MTIVNVFSFNAMPHFNEFDYFMRQAYRFIEQAHDSLLDIYDEELDEQEDDKDGIMDEDETHTIPPMSEPQGELRFGAGFEIDEPRREDYVSRYDFEDDHAAFDRFVDAGEDCVARGLEKKSDAPITKCNAIRTKVGERPPIGIDIIGETHWWQTPFTW